MRGMRQTELTRLRRKRYAIQRALMPIERALALHQTRLAEVETAIPALDPVPALPLPRPERTAIFAIGELTRLAPVMLRQAGSSLAMREMVRFGLAPKGLPFPDRRSRTLTPRRLPAAFEWFVARGFLAKVGRGHEARRVPVEG
jgi:hypothetical protein